MLRADWNVLPKNASKLKKGTGVPFFVMQVLSLYFLVKLLSPFPLRNEELPTEDGRMMTSIGLPLITNRGACPDVGAKDFCRKGEGIASADREWIRALEK